MEELVPETFGRGEFVDQTTLHPLGLVALIVLGVLMLALPRRFAILPMIAMACLVATAQRIVLAGMDFNLLRVMVLIGWARLVVRNETEGFVWKPIDTLIVLWALSATTIYTIQQGTFEDLVNRLGFSFDAAGMYFLFRCLIRGMHDIDRVVYSFIIVSIPVAIAFLIENSTGRNAFAFFGGVPEITKMREGRLRCQGAFSHPIMAGCFWASMMPLFAACWWNGRSGKIAAVIGVVTATIIVVCCASSTPLVAILCAVFAAGMFAMRTRMRQVRWAIVLGLVGLHFTMKAPVWHLIARIDFVGGSTGWHRFILLDGAIRHWEEWWLIGTRSTYHWDKYGLFDITNQYVLEGVNGGLLTLVLFLGIITVAFKAVGRMWRAYSGRPADVAMAWALGVALFVHCVNFFGVSYFGQIILVWYLLLAMIASADQPVTVRVRRRRKVVRVIKRATPALSP